MDPASTSSQPCRKKIYDPLPVIPLSQLLQIPLSVSNLPSLLLLLLLLLEISWRIMAPSCSCARNRIRAFENGQLAQFATRIVPSQFCSDLLFRKDASLYLPAGSSKLGTARMLPRQTRCAKSALLSRGGLGSPELPRIRRSFGPLPILQ